MNAFLIGLIFLIAVLILAGVGLLLLPVILIFGWLFNLLLAFGFLIFVIWLLGKLIIFFWKYLIHK